MLRSPPFPLWGLCGTGDALEKIVPMRWQGSDCSELVSQDPLGIQITYTSGNTAQQEGQSPHWPGFLGGNLTRIFGRR